MLRANSSCLDPTELLTRVNTSAFDRPVIDMQQILPPKFIVTQRELPMMNIQKAIISEDYNLPPVLIDSKLHQQFLTLGDRLSLPSRTKVQKILEISNPFEGIGKSIFQNRAATKLAAIQSIYGVFEDHMNTFIDIAGGPGSWSQYMQFLSPTAIGWGITLKDGFDWELDKYNIDRSRFSISYGTDGTGDIMNADNRRSILQSISGDGLDLAVADGGIGTSQEYYREEILHVPLFLSEIVLALNVLKTGGNFILKIFNTFTELTAQILYLLMQCFESMTIFKPISSRPANSEKYVICQHLIGDRDFILEIVMTLENILSLHADNVIVTNIFDFNEQADHIAYLDTLKYINLQMLKRQMRYLDYNVKVREGLTPIMPKYDVIRVHQLWVLPIVDNSILSWLPCNQITPGVNLITEPSSMTSVKVAIFTHNKNNLEHKVQGFKTALENQGYEVHIFPWLLEKDLSTFQYAIIRTTWDYVSHVDKFTAWLKQFPVKYPNLVIINPIKTLLWNMNKFYLKDLQQQRVAIPQTIFVEQGDIFDISSLSGDRSYIIKPNIGNSAYGIRRLSVPPTVEDQKAIDDLLQIGGVLIQPFIDTITTKGEKSLIMINGEVVEAIVKYPKPGDFRVHSFHGGNSRSYQPTVREIAFVKNALGVINDLGYPCRYGRVDIFTTSDDELLLSEVELIEPSLPNTELINAALVEMITNSTKLLEMEYQRALLLKKISLLVIDERIPVTRELYQNWILDLAYLQGPRQDAIFPPLISTNSELIDIFERFFQTLSNLGISDTAWRRSQVIKLIKEYLQFNETISVDVSIMNNILTVGEFSFRFKARNLAYLLSLSDKEQLAMMMLRWYSLEDYCPVTKIPEGMKFVSPFASDSPFRGVTSLADNSPVFTDPPLSRVSETVEDIDETNICVLYLRRPSIEQNDLLSQRATDIINISGAREARIYIFNSANNDLISEHFRQNHYASNISTPKLASSVDTSTNAELSIIFESYGWNTDNPQSIPLTKFHSFNQHSLPQAITDVLSQLAVKFPLKNRYRTLDEVLLGYRSLLSYENPWNHEPYTIRYVSTSLPLPIKFSQPGFEGQSEYFLMPVYAEDYSEINWIVDWFIEESRMHCIRSFDDADNVLMSPHDLWYQYGNYVRKSVESALTSPSSILSLKSLREGIYEKFGYMECGHEKATVLRMLFQYLMDGRGGSIFDACAGWGDRLIAAMSLGMRYIGIDPNLRSKHAYRAMIDTLNADGRDISHVYSLSMPLVLDEMTECNIVPGSFDLAFMSPPSLRSEIYSDDPGQSIVRFGDQEQRWLDEFLHPTIEQTWSMVKLGGYMIVQSIVIKFIAPYIATHLPDAFLCGPISSTYPSGNKPLWIWKKVKSQQYQNTNTMCLGEKNFPYIKSILPSPIKMFDNLINSVTVATSSAMATRLQRKWPADYFASDWISNHYTEVQRMECNKIGRPSPKAYWDDNKNSFCVPSTSRNPIMDANDKLFPYICNNFNPAYCLRMILDTVGPNAKILDPSAGWGDRLIAALASKAALYFGVDPNTSLTNGYKQIVTELGGHLYPKLSSDELHKHYKVIVKFFQDVKVPVNFFDLVLTSPPYGPDLEQYKGSEEQHNSPYGIWLDKVYRPYIHNMYLAAKVGGWIIMYVEDFRLQGKVYKFREDTIELFKQYPVERQSDYELQVLNTEDTGKKAVVRASVRWIKKG